MIYPQWHAGGPCRDSGQRHITGAIDIVTWMGQAMSKSISALAPVNNSGAITAGNCGWCARQQRERITTAQVGSTVTVSDAGLEPRFTVYSALRQQQFDGAAA